MRSFWNLNRPSLTFLIVALLTMFAFSALMALPTPVQAKPKVVSPTKPSADEASQYDILKKSRPRVRNTRM